MSAHHTITTPAVSRHKLVLTLFSTGTAALMAVSCRHNAGPTNQQIYSKVALETQKFSFHQPSSDLSFSNPLNQSYGQGRLRTLRRARALVPRRRICLVLSDRACAALGFSYARSKPRNG